MQCSNLWILCTHWRSKYATKSTGVWGVGLPASLCMFVGIHQSFLPLLKQQKCNYLFTCMCVYSRWCVYVFIRPWPVRPQCEILPSDGSDLFQRRSIQSLHEHQPWAERLSGKHAVQLHATLLKHYFPTHSHSTSLLDQPAFSHSALTSVYVWTRLLTEFTSYISMWPIVSVCSDATDILYVSEYLKSIRFLCDLELKRKKLFALLNYSYF